MAHSIICPTHGPLIDLKQHCHNLAQFFISANPYDFDPVTSWLKISSGITEVKFISDLFDPDVMWCGSAMEYEDAKSEFHSRLICELTRFIFIWGGLELLVDMLTLKNCPHYPGKVNKVNYFLKENYKKRYQVIDHYQDVVECLKILLTRNTWYGDVKDIFSSSKCTCDDLIGLKAVYKIRNLFAHGAFHFSEPEDWNMVKPLDVPIVATSSRIVLMTMQMLLLSYYDVLSFPIIQYGNSLDCEKEIQAEDFLLKMHLKSFYEKTHHS